MLRAGRVTVNGAVAGLGDSADPDRDAVAVDGEPIRREPDAYWLVHKPRGVLTTTTDPFGRPTVLGLLPPQSRRVFPVGRLDLDSEGLVLVTNDGALAQRLLHPSHGAEREYRVTTRGRIGADACDRLAGGMVLEDGPTAPAAVGTPRYDPRTDTSELTLVVTEGRKRQIRRMLEALGHPVVRLVRVRMGPLRLGRLAPGAARRLTARERSALRALRSER